MAKNTGYTGKGSLLSKFRKAVLIILSKNLSVKKRERLLIVYDKETEDLAERFTDIAKESLDKVESLKIPVLNANGAEPRKKEGQKFLNCNVLILLTSKSLSHTKARRDCTKKGIRIASMPGITNSILKRSIDVDYDKLKEDSKRAGRLINSASEVRIKTGYGTNISFSIKGRKAHGLKSGIYNKKGYWGNLPEGEVFVAPVEGSANGVFVVFLLRKVFESYC